MFEHAALDTLTPDCLAVAIELRRLKVGLIADGKRLHFYPQRRVNGTLQRKLQQHAKELIAFINSNAEARQ